MEEKQIQPPEDSQQEIATAGIDPFSPPPEPQKNRFSKKRIVLVIVALLVLGAIGFAAALFTSGEDTQTPTVADEQQEKPTTTTNSTSDIQTVTTTKTLKADFPRVEVTYPDNWIITENRDQEGIRIESPEFTYTSITGSPVKGNFRIYIRQGARQQDSKYIAKGIAIQASEKLVYSNPLSSQRPETDLSFFGLDSSDNFGYIMLTPNFVLEKDQSIGPEYAKEKEAYVVSGGYSSSELTDDLATNPVPVEYFNSTNAYKQALDILESLKFY